MWELVTDNTATGLTALAVYIASFIYFSGLKDAKWSIGHVITTTVASIIFTFSIGLIPIFIVNMIFG